MSATRLGGSHTGARSLADEVPFELGDGADDVEQKTPARSRRIDGFGKGAEPHSFGSEACDDLHEVRETAPQPVEFSNDEHIAGGERC